MLLVLSIVSILATTLGFTIDTDVGPVPRPAPLGRTTYISEKVVDDIVKEALTLNPKMSQSTLGWVKEQAELFATVTRFQITPELVLDVALNTTVSFYGEHRKADDVRPWIFGEAITVLRSDTFGGCVVEPSLFTFKEGVGTKMGTGYTMSTDGLWSPYTPPPLRFDFSYNPSTGFRETSVLVNGVGTMFVSDFDHLAVLCSEK